MQLLFAKGVLNMEGNIVSDTFIHFPGGHCCCSVTLYRFVVLVAWEKHNHGVVIADHVDSIVPGEHPSCFHGVGEGEDFVILFIVLDEVRTIYSLLLL